MKVDTTGKNGTLDGIKVTVDPVDDIRIADDQTPQAYTPREIESKATQKSVTTEELKLENVAANIKQKDKDPVLEISGDVANLPNKPRIKLSGTVDEVGRFVLHSEDTNESYNGISVGRCELEKQQNGSYRLKSFYADVYVKTDTKVFNRQIKKDKIEYDNNSAHQTIQQGDSQCKDGEYCDEPGDFVGIPIKLEDIPAPAPKPEPANGTIGLQPPQTQPAVPTISQIISPATEKLEQAFGYYDGSQGSIKARLEHADTVLNSQDVLKTNIETNANFGTRNLVSLVKAIDHEVTLIYPGQRPVIGNMSLQKGGKLPCDSKKDKRCSVGHQNGNEVDVSFLVSTNQPRHFTAIAAGQTLSPLFKVKENWEMTKWINKNSRVAMFFVHQAVKQAYCAYAKQNGELEKEADTLKKLIINNDHYDHTHVRLFCQENDEQCIQPKNLPTKVGC